MIGRLCTEANHYHTTNRPVLFLEGVRPRGARRSRNFLHYLVWEKGGNLGTFFSIQFGKKGRRGARPWRAFLVASSDVGQVRIGLRGVSIGAALQAQQGARSGSGGGYAPSIDRCARSVLLLTRFVEHTAACTQARWPAPPPGGRRWFAALACSKSL